MIYNVKLRFLKKNYQKILKTLFKYLYKQISKKFRYIFIIIRKTHILCKTYLNCLKIQNKFDNSLIDWFETTSYNKSRFTYIKEFYWDFKIMKTKI